MHALTNMMIAIGLAMASSAGMAMVSISVEAPGAQNSTVAYTGGAATFDALSGYNENVVVSLGDRTATFDSLLASSSNVYGGAGGSSFVTVQSMTSISLSSAANYFGLWASALDGGNTVELLSGGTSLGSFNLTAFALDDAYRGNPAQGYGNGGEKYAFFNFHSGSSFDQIRLIENGGGGFELDNVTIGNAIPEPSSWALMLLGFGAIGYSMRRQLPLKLA